MNVTKICTSKLVVKFKELSKRKEKLMLTNEKLSIFDEKVLTMIHRELNNRGLILKGE